MCVCVCVFLSFSQPQNSCKMYTCVRACVLDLCVVVVLKSYLINEGKSFYVFQAVLGDCGSDGSVLKAA